MNVHTAVLQSMEPQRFGMQARVCIWWKYTISRVLFRFLYFCCQMILHGYLLFLQFCPGSICDTFWTTSFVTRRLSGSGNRLSWWLSARSLKICCAGCRSRGGSDGRSSSADNSLDAIAASYVECLICASIHFILDVTHVMSLPAALSASGIHC